MASLNAFVVRAGAARNNQRATLFGCCPNDVKVAASDTGSALAVFEYRGQVRGGPPLHVHEDQDEIYVVRDGDWLFEVGGVRHQLEAGDTIFLPRQIPHSFAQLSDEGSLTFLFTPAGQMAEFFEALSCLQGPPTPEAEAALFAAHGMQVVGPPISVD